MKSSPWHVVLVLLPRLQVCDLFKVPMFCVKAITDIVDGGRPSEEEFLENLHAAAASLQATLPKVLAFMDGKTTAQL